MRKSRNKEYTQQIYYFKASVSMGSGRKVNLQAEKSLNTTNSKKCIRHSTVYSLCGRCMCLSRNGY